MLRRLTFGVLLWSSVVSLAAEKSNLIDIRSFSEPDAFVVELKFDKKAPTAGISTEFINETIQVNIPNGFLPQGTRTARIHNGQVHTLYTYQFDKDVLRSRIILRKGLLAEKFRGAVSIEPEGKILRLRLAQIEPKTTAQLLDATPVLPQALRSEIVQELGATTPAPKTLPVATLLSKDSTESTGSEIPETKASDSNEEAKIPVLNKGKIKSMKSETTIKGLVIAMGAVALLAVFMFFISRQWIKMGRKSLKANQIKVITQHYLAPKKSLAIIRVAGESILIGITDHAITPIKTLSLLDEELPEEVPDDFQKSLREVEETSSKYSLPEAPTDKLSLSGARGIQAYTHSKVKRTSPENPEEFSITGIKQLVKEKLKDMRTI